MWFTALALLVIAVSCSVEPRGGAAVSGNAGGSAAAGSGGSANGGSSGWSSGGQDASLGGAGGTAASAGAAGAPADAGDGDAGDGPECAAHPGSSPFVVNGSTHCYWRSAAPGKFADAVADCSANGAYLVSIHSGPENELVRGLAGVDTLWIGVTDDKNADDQSCDAESFGWVSGEALSYTNWTDNNPDCVCGGCDGGCACQHRAAMLPDGGWRDRWGGDGYPWICEVGLLVP